MEAGDVHPEGEGEVFEGDVEFDEEKEKADDGEGEGDVVKVELEEPHWTGTMRACGRLRDHILVRSSRGRRQKGC